MDWLNLGQVLTGVIKTGADALDPYNYTEQEKAADAIKTGQIAQANNATAAQVAIAHEAAQTKENIVKYGLLGVLGVGGLYLAGQLIRGK